MAVDRDGPAQQGVGVGETPDDVGLLLGGATGEADEGKGGRIDIVAEAILADPDSEIDASSQAGIDGEVNIDALRANLSDIMTPLSPRFVVIRITPFAPRAP